MKNVGQSMTRAGRRMTLGITLPLAAAGVASFKMADDFETSMSRVIGLAGQSEEQVDKWSKQILKLGPELGRPPRELAEALYFVASSGAPVAKAMDIVTASAKAATAGLGDTQTIADTLTSVINAYGAANLDAADAAGILVATVREGKGEASDFAPIIGNVTAFASKLGVSFQDVGGALAAMTQLGTDAATAGTQLTAFFSGLVKETPKGAKALKEVGLSYDGLRKSLKEKGLLATLALLDKAFEGNVVGMAKVFGNVRALRALFGLLDEDGSRVEGIFKRMGESSAKDLAKAFEESTKRSGFTMEKFRAGVEAMGIAVGSILAPVVTKIASLLTRLSIAFSNLDPDTQKFIITIGVVAAAIGPVLLILGSLITALAVVVTPIVALGAALGILIGAIVIAGTAPDTLAAALEKMGLSAETAENLVAGMASTFNTFRTAISTLITTIGPLLSLLGQLAAVALPAIFSSWGQSAGVAAVTMFGVSKAISAITAAIGILRAASLAAVLSAMTNPATLALVAIGLVAGAILKLKIDADNAAAALDRTKAALDGLRDSANEAVHGQQRLAEAKHALKQATQNVSQALVERTRLEDSGKRKSEEYKQAQLNVEAAYLGRKRAGIELNDAETGLINTSQKSREELTRLWKEGNNVENSFKTIKGGLLGLISPFQAIEFNAKGYAKSMRDLANDADKVAKKHDDSNPKIAAGAREFAEAARTAAKYAEATGKIPPALEAVKGPAATAGKNVGAAFGQGIALGINSYIGDIATAAADAVIAAESAARSQAGAKSPSQLFALLGLDLGSGLVKGFTEKYANLGKAGKEGIDKMMESAVQALTASKGIFSTAFDGLVSAALAAFDKISSEFQTKTEKLIARQDEARAKADRKQALTDANRALQEAKNEFFATQPKAVEPRKEGESESDFAARQAEADADYAQRIAAATQAITDAEKARADALFAINRAANEKRAAQERQEYEAKRERQRLSLEQQLAKLEANFLNQELSTARFHKSLLRIFKEFEVPLGKQAAKVGAALANGLNSSFGEVQRAARALASEILRQFEGLVVRVNIDLQHVDGDKKKPGEKALGGPVKRNAPYIVGERGPELFVPTTSGRIIPNGGGGGTALASGGGGTVVFNFPNYVGSRQELQQAMQDTVAEWGRRNSGAFFAGRG